MRICKQTLALLLTLCLAVTLLPTVVLASDFSDGGAETTATSEASNPTTDEEIQAALETYDDSIDDPEYQKAYERYQNSLSQDPDDSIQTYASGGNPYTGKTYTHKHASTKYIYDGIDVSKWQASIDWKQVKADGIDFAFIRCGATSTSSFTMMPDFQDKDDPSRFNEKFIQNVNGAYAAGIKVGVYYYSGATSASEAKKEANYVLDLISPYKSKITLPVVMDYETNGSDRIYKNYKKTSKATRTTYVQNFCNILENAGYDGGFYASKAWLTDFFTVSKLANYSCWVAQWASSTSYANDYDFWQYSESGEINGISAAVDCNFWYTNTKISGNSSSPTLLAPYITTTNVNYRSGAGTSYTKKGSIAKGKPVSVVYGWYKKVNGTKWYKVKISGKYYYMSGNYLTYETLVKYAATTNKLRYRTGCGTNYSIKGTIAKGDTVQIVKGWNKKSGGETWYKAKIRGGYYYIMAKYLDKQETLLQYASKAKVNVRSGAGTSKTLKATIQKDTPVTVVSGGKKTVSGRKWYRVKINTSYYYIMASYLTKK